MRRALEIFVASLGWDHPNTQTVFANYLGILAALKGVSVETLLHEVQKKTQEGAAPKRRGLFSRLFGRR